MVSRGTYRADDATSSGAVYWAYGCRARASRAALHERLSINRLMALGGPCRRPVAQWVCSFRNSGCCTLAHPRCGISSRDALDRGLGTPIWNGSDRRPCTRGARVHLPHQPPARLPHAAASTRQLTSRHRPAGLRRQRVRLERRRKALVRPARCLRRRRLQPDRHRRRVFGGGAGSSRRRVGDHHRQVAQTGRQARAGGDRHQGRQVGRAAGTVAGEHPSGRGRLAAAAAGGLHRSLPGARGRRQRAAGGHPRRVRAADRGRQAARDRRLQLWRRAAGRCAGGLEEARPAPLRKPAAGIQPGQPRRLRKGAGAADPAREPGRDQLLRAGQRFPQRQVPQRRRPGAEQRPRRRGEAVPESARAAGPDRAGCGGRGAPGHARAGGAGVADGAPGHHRADRQRHQRGAVRRTGGRGRAVAGCQRDRRAGPGQQRRISAPGRRRSRWRRSPAPRCRRRRACRPRHRRRPAMPPHNPAPRAG